MTSFKNFVSTRSFSNIDMTSLSILNDDVLKNLNHTNSKSYSRN